MEIISYEKPNVLVIKDFIPKEDVKRILSALENTTEDQWHIDTDRKQKAYERQFGPNAEESFLKKSDKIWEDMTLNINNPEESSFLYPHLPHQYLNMVQKMIQKVTQERFSENLVMQLSGLHRWRPGREQRPHLDYFLDEEDHDFEKLARFQITKEDTDKFKQNFNDKHYSSLLYFNDNYVGGELYMPQYNFEIKPEPGMLICFKGDEDHLHGVKMVEEGIRYTWSIFWTRLDWYMKNKMGVQK